MPKHRGHRPAVEASDLPSDADVSAHLIHVHPDDDEAEFVIFESDSEEEVEEQDGERSGFTPFDFEFDFSNEQMGQLPELEPTLTLDSDKFTVSRIFGVAYESDSTDVRRLRTTKKKGSKEDF